MPLDPYSLCPGGRDKKIRFCCSDMIKEIDQIERLLESKQTGACLTFIENLEKTHPDCACLNAAKLAIYRTEDRPEDALALATRFAEREPENPVAASEYALALAAHGNFQRAVGILVDGFEHCKESTIHSSLLTGALQVAVQLFVTGHILPSIGICNRLKAFPMVAEQANAVLLQASSMSEIPLQLRDMLFDNDCPADFPDKAEFENAIEFLALMQWKKALAKFESLTVHAGVWPNIQRNVAAVRYWLLDNDGGNEAMRRFASLSNALPEDAADAEAIRLFMSKDGLGDKTELLRLEIPITDTEAVQERLLSAGSFVMVDFDKRAYTSNSVPPPLSVFVALDRPVVKAPTGMTLQTVATQMATCLLFGKETDRLARLEVQELPADDRPIFDSLLRATLGELCQEPVKTEVFGVLSKTHAKIQRRFHNIPPDVATVHTIVREYYMTEFVDFWCNHPLGLLDGRTPQETANDPLYVPRIQGAIQLLDYWMSNEAAEGIADVLRSRLGLPLFGPIEFPVGDALEVLDAQPIWRWHRFDVEKLPLDALLEGLQILSVMKEPRALYKFAQELLNRPMKEMPPQARNVAFEGLHETCVSVGRFEEALEWIEKAKNEAMEEKRSDAVWNLREVTILLGLGRAEEVHTMLQHLISEHGKEQGVMQALNNLFVRLGLINPDGTPTARALRPQEAQQSGSVAGLWTPDAEAGLPVGNTSKLWVPD